MLTFRYLLALAAAVAATAAAAVAVSGVFMSNTPLLASTAASIAAGKTAHLDTPVPVRQYLAYYSYAGGKWVLVNTSGVPVYILGLGQCPQSLSDLLNKTFTAGNATVVLANCVLIMPWVQDGTITHYAATCRSGTDFKPETVEAEASGAKVRLAIVNC